MLSVLNHNIAKMLVFLTAMATILTISPYVISYSSSSASSGVSVKQWGPDGAFLLYTLTAGNSKLQVTDWGATITSFTILDHKTGKDVDIVLGFDSLEPYMNGTSPYFGTIVGRVANRIKDAKFTLNGTTYTLTVNDHGNTLHGGLEGYNSMAWRSRVVTKSSPSPSVEFLLYSYTTEQGFPGSVDISVMYTLSQNELKVKMKAKTRDKMTPINLAHHSYWNLGGHKSGSILNHKVRIFASHYTPVNDILIPTGQILPVQNTPFDFRTPVTIGKRIDQVKGGYDHNFCLENYMSARRSTSLFPAVTVEDPVSTRRMEIWTNQPGLQFYAGNQIVRIAGKDGAVYTKHAGLCLETQGYPNAVNQPNFPSVILKPGEVYHHVMVHKFT